MDKNVIYSPFSIAASDVINSGTYRRRWHRGGVLARSWLVLVLIGRRIVEDGDRRRTASEAEVRHPVRRGSAARQWPCWPASIHPSLVIGPCTVGICKDKHIRVVYISTRRCFSWRSGRNGPARLLLLLLQLCTMIQRPSDLLFHLIYNYYILS